MKRDLLRGGMFVICSFVLLAGPMRAWSAADGRKTPINGRLGDHAFGPDTGDDGLGRMQVDPQLSSDALSEEFAAPVADTQQRPITSMGGQATATVAAGPMQQISYTVQQVEKSNSSPAQVEGVLKQTYDADAKSGEVSAVSADGSGNNGEGGGIGDGSGGSFGSGPSESWTPRITMIEDVFVEQADEKTVEHIETLLNAPGSHVVFLTSRSLDEAGQILLEKLRGRRNNPLIVVSENGTRIFLNGKKAPVNEYGALNQNDLDKLSSIDSTIRRAMGISESPKKVEAGEEPVYWYRWSPPDSVPAEQISAKLLEAKNFFNSAFRSGHLPYIADVDRVDGHSLKIHPMAIHLALPRLKQVLQEQFANEFPNEQALMEQSNRFYMLIRNPNLGRALSSMFPAAEIVPVSNAADVREALESAIFKKTLRVVKFRLASLRSFLWWERSKKYSESNVEIPEGGSGAPSLTGDSVDKALSAYVGSVIQTHLSWVWGKMKVGNSASLGRTQMLEKLRQLWFVPTSRDHVFISPDVAGAKRSPEWAERQTGFFDYAAAWFNKYYDRSIAKDEGRKLSDITEVAADARANVLHLASYYTRGDLELVSRISKRVFKFYINVKRLMMRDTADGTVLTAYEYRTGRPSEDADKLQAQVWALFILQRQGRLGDDGQWHHLSPDGPKLSRVDVQFEYFGWPRVFSFKPEELLLLNNGRIEFGPVATEVTNLAVRADADEEFKQHDRQQYEAQKALEEAERAHYSESSTKKPVVKKAKRAKKPKARSAKGRKA